MLLPCSGAAVGAGGSTSELLANGRWADNDQLLQMMVTFDGTTLTYYLNSETDFTGFNTTNNLSASFNNPGFNLSSLTQAAPTP
ncbi:MAG: hypothetical protein EOO77_33320, partial [Oxalobacteraceae bacterium]